jgi:hypothetical protein
MEYLDTMETSGEISKVAITNKSGGRPTYRIALCNSFVTNVPIVPKVPIVPIVTEIHDVCIGDSCDNRDNRDNRDKHDNGDNSSITAHPAAKLDERLCAKCHKHMGMSANLPGLGEVCLDCLEAST